MEIEVKHLNKKFVEAVAQKISTILETNKPKEGAKITIEAVDVLIKDAVYLKELVEDFEAITTSLNKAAMSLQQTAGGYLKALGREDYSSPVGHVEIKSKWAVRMPKDEDSKVKLFEYLKSRGLFESMATVNVRTLNSYYMKAWEIAKEEDPANEILFSMPGIEAPVLDEYTVIKENKETKQKESNYGHVTD